MPRLRSMLLVLAALAAPAAPAAGQEHYRLGDQDQWSEQAAPDPGSPEGQLGRIRRAIAESQWERAALLASQWIERYPRHPLLAEAYLARGDALLGRGEEYEALFDYEYVARVFPGSEAFVTALQRELAVARDYAHGRKRKLWGLRIVDTEDEAEELLIRIQERMPGSSLAEDAGMELGDFYFRRRDMGLAADAYELFIENHPRSTRIAKARRRLIYAHLASFKGPEFDASGLYEARALLRDLIAVEPATAQQIGAEALLHRIDDSDAWKRLEQARWYVQIGDPVAAELVIRRLLEDYPRTVAAGEALRMVPSIRTNLPPSVVEAMPDYDAWRAALLGSAEGGS